MKQLPYFKFDVSEYITGTVTLEDFYVQGVFTNICAHYWVKAGKVTLTEIKRRLSKAKPTAFDSLIENGIIKVESDNISISFLDEQLHERGVVSEKNSKNGKLGGRPPKSENKPIAILNESESKAIESNIEENREEQNKKEQKRTKSSSADAEMARIKKLPFEERILAFKDAVTLAGSMVYTKRMLDDFTDYWSEPNADNTKYRWEDPKQKYFRIILRLGNWASKNDKKYPCKLTESERTIKQKKHDFAIQLEHYFPETPGDHQKYPKEMLRKFWEYWSMPENIPDPKRLAWEMKDFWLLETKLKEWSAGNPVQTNKVA